MSFWSSCIAIIFVFSNSTNSSFDLENLSIASEKLDWRLSQTVTNRSICFLLPDLSDAEDEVDGNGDGDNGDSWVGDGGDSETENEFLEFMYLD